MRVWVAIVAGVVLAGPAVAGTGPLPSQFGQNEAGKEAETARLCRDDGVCALEVNEGRRDMAKAWPYMSVEQEDMLASIISTETKPEGVDWRWVAKRYRAGAAFQNAPASAKTRAVEARPPSIRTRCYTHISKNGRNIYSSCY